MLWWLWLGYFLLGIFSSVFSSVCHSTGWTVILLLILFSKGTIPWVILWDSFLVFKAVSSVLFWNVLFLEPPGYFPSPMRYGLQRSCHMILFSPGRVWRSHGYHQAPSVKGRLLFCPAGRCLVLAVFNDRSSLRPEMIYFCMGAGGGGAFFQEILLYIENSFSQSLPLFWPWVLGAWISPFSMWHPFKYLKALF